MKNLNLLAPCLFGLEGLVSDELKRLGLKTDAQNGRVFFEGTALDMCRANIFSRFSERVLIVLGEFDATTFDMLFEGTKALPFEDFITIDGEFPVKGYCLNSKLYSVPDCQAIIKKAAVERLKQKYHVSWFKETGAKYQIQFSIMKDKVTIMLDTSGEGLHKRGYRANANIAPLRETLAAAMVYLSKYRAGIPFIDPFCGSGTILIEAALQGRNIAPGINRRFSAQNWTIFDKTLWDKAKDEARSLERDRQFMVTGFDIDKKSVELTLQNAEKAGVEKYVEAIERDIRGFKASQKDGIIVTNPPYGERMLEKQEAQELYKIMGKQFFKLDNWRYFIISSHEEFEKYFGKTADKKRKLYNGMIKCDYYQYFKHFTPKKMNKNI